MRCPNCGQENEENSISCLFCGNPLEASSAADDAAADLGQSGADSDYAVYREGSRSSRTRILSIIVSALVVLLLLSFVFMIYRRLTTADKDTSGLFKEETEYDPPLLLPGFTTDPIQPFTLPTTSSISTTSSSSEEPTTLSTSTTTRTTTTSQTNSPPSIRVIEKTEIETEPVNSTPTTAVNTASVSGTDTADVSSTAKKTEKATAETTERTTAETTERTTAETTERTATKTTPAITEPKLPASVRIYKVDSSESPLIRLDFGVIIEKDEKGNPLIELEQLKLCISERQKADDDWVEQSCLFIKETASITVVANFAQTFESEGTIKESLLEFIDAMKLNPNKPADEKEKKLEGSTLVEWDMFSLINYGLKVQEPSEMTPYFVDAKLAIDNSPIQEKTDEPRLHSALTKAIENSAKITSGSVVIITDGRYFGDNELSVVEAQAKTEKIPVHIIYICDQDSIGADEVDIAGRHSKQTLREFARNTGGDLCPVDAQSEDWAAQLTTALLSALVRDKEEGSFLTYKSSFGSVAATTHQVLLELYLDDDLISSDYSYYDVPAG